MKIGIIGDGNVGSALQRGLSRKHEARTVGHDPAKVRETGAWAEVVILAVPFGAVDETLKELGDIGGKVLVDATNSLTKDMQLAAQGAEELQKKTKAKVVKAFNTVFAKYMDSGKLNGTALTAFVAGDDAAARKTVAQLASDIGFDAVESGALRNARWLETMGYLNIQLAFVDPKLGPTIGFKLVR